jgi:hypothetical protein
MATIIQADRGDSANHPAENRPDSKWAALIGDALFPMPRPDLTARDILDQAGAGTDVMLQRDYNGVDDVTFADDARVDLREGNVFRLVPRCAPSPATTPAAKPKLAFVADDAWEVTVTPHQTGHSLKRLLGLPDDAELFRDLESPADQPVRDDEALRFADGPVFTVRKLRIKVLVNTHHVFFTHRRVTGLEIKQTAIAQQVAIKPDFVLYRLKPDGSLGPAIRDDQHVVLRECEAFSCVAPDDNS